MDLINDWFDFTGIFFFNFLIIMIGIWILPQLPEKTHFLFAPAILVSACYFTKKALEFLFPKSFEIEKKKKTKNNNNPTAKDYHNYSKCFIFLVTLFLIVILFDYQDLYLALMLYSGIMFIYFTIEYKYLCLKGQKK